MLSSSCPLGNMGFWGKEKNESEQGSPDQERCMETHSSAGAETMILMQEMRTERPFTCLNSLLNLDVNAIFGEAPKTENTAYTVMSDRCI